MINATIGILVPISVTADDGFVPLTFRQSATSILLAIHHVNTRDGSIVGDAVNLLPHGFQLKYKLSDTHFSISGGVQALLNWRSQEDYAGFEIPALQTGNSSQGSIKGNPKRTPLYSARSSDRINAILCADLSEVSVAVSVIAGLEGTPVISSYSTSTTLSDKSKFPLFSRTVPVQSFNMLGMAKVMSAFGWRQCAILYLDSEYGNSFATDLLQKLGDAGIRVVLMQKFINRGTASITAGVEALRASGARIFATILQGTENLELILAAAAHAGIAGVDGFAWFSGSDLSLHLCCISATVRPLLSGWLYLRFDPLYGDKRERYQRVFEAVDRAAVWDPLVVAREPWFLSAPHRGFDALAYDAVWATALGLAHTDPESIAGSSAGRGGGRTGRELARQIRESRFYGASGYVAFDNATGDRAAAGLQMQVMNVQPNETASAMKTLQGAEAAWRSAVLNASAVSGADNVSAWSGLLEEIAVDTSWLTGLVGVEIGVWEANAGFQRSSNATPVWPGGRSTWDAPWDGSIWEAAALVPYLLAAALAALVVAMLAGAAAGASLARRVEYAAVERQIAAMAAVRAQLGIRREDGFVIAGLERVQVEWWKRSRSLGFRGWPRVYGRRRVVALRREWVEAAAALYLLEDFDVAMLDALCEALHYDEPDASGPSSAAAFLGTAAACIAPSDTTASFATSCDSSDSSIIPLYQRSTDFACADSQDQGLGEIQKVSGGGRGGRKEYQRLCEWLLDLSLALLRPDPARAPAASGPFARLASSVPALDHAKLDDIGLAAGAMAPVSGHAPASQSALDVVSHSPSAGAFLDLPLSARFAIHPSRPPPPPDLDAPALATSTGAAATASSATAASAGRVLGQLRRGSLGWKHRGYRQVDYDDSHPFLRQPCTPFNAKTLVAHSLQSAKPDDIQVCAPIKPRSYPSYPLSLPVTHLSAASAAGTTPPAVGAVRTYRKGLRSMSLGSTMTGGNGKLDVGSGGGGERKLTMESPASERFEYLSGRVLRASVWRDGGGALFARLQAAAKELTEGLADRCDRRFSELLVGPCGRELSEVRELPPAAAAWVASLRKDVGSSGGDTGSSAGRAQEGLGQKNGEKDWRQDDPLVRAIRVDDDDRRDALSQQQLHPFLSVLNENVFIAQLARRSRLLNDHFQSLVSRAVRTHAADPRSTPVPIYTGHGGDWVDGSFTRASSYPAGGFGAAAIEASIRNSRLFMRTISAGTAPAPPRLYPSSAPPPPRSHSTIETVLCHFSPAVAGSSGGADKNDSAAPCARTITGAAVTLQAGPEKQEVRMREKLIKYAGPDGPGEWPLTAYVLDPIRASIICEGAEQMLQVMSWFTDRPGETGLPVCRIKNKFARARESTVDGYRDVKMSVIVTGSDGLRIIAEIQIHDVHLFDLKSHMHRLYKIKRATGPLNI